MEFGFTRLLHALRDASRVDPTCGVKPRNDVNRWRFYSAIVRTTLDVGRTSPPPGPFTTLRTWSS